MEPRAVIKNMVQYSFLRKGCIAVLLLLTLAGCVGLAKSELSQLFGTEEPAERQVAVLPSGHVDYWQEVKPILDNRCVVCHGCYDAPCQLKLTSVEGVVRGASKQAIYQASRLKAANPTRLYEDAHSIAAWRSKGFYPVLNERLSTEVANRESSTMYQLLDMKERHPLPATQLLSDDFTTALGREESCPASDEMAAYQAEHPLWGMPYALPGLAEAEQSTLKNWLDQGATYVPRKPLDARFSVRIKQWEALLNGESLKSRLASRYIYEHLFLGHLYFPDIAGNRFFKLVRSRTSPETPVDIIASRRPFDDPGVGRVFYRIVPQHETIVLKSHMPYALDDKRMANWKKWFYDADFVVDKLPGYHTKKASNPFAVFKQLPMQSRYRFLLEEAHFSIGNYIKGSVCRGQLALNVIRDRFWVFFVNPDFLQTDALSEMIEVNVDAFDLPASSGDIYFPVASWIKYAAKQRDAMRSRNQFLQLQHGEGNPISLDLIWDGDGENPNAALTIFRHLNTASVEKGLLGEHPRTAWLISYPLLEQIHYLLVAGYDVYGNFGHQLLSRLYMDFLRIDGELSFLGLLPEEARKQQWQNWYRSKRPELISLLTNQTLHDYMHTEIAYKTDNPKAELFEMLANRLGSSLTQRRSLENINSATLKKRLERLASFNGENTRFLPEVSYIRFKTGDDNRIVDVTLLRNNAHSSMTSIFSESSTLAPAENTVTVLNGMVGAYPNAFFEVSERKSGEFVNQLLSLRSAEDYRRLKSKFGIRRTSARFWQYSDALHTTLREENETEYGVLDYSRLENR